MSICIPGNRKKSHFSYTSMILEYIDHEYPKIMEEIFRKYWKIIEGCLLYQIFQNLEDENEQRYVSDLLVKLKRQNKNNETLGRLDRKQYYPYMTILVFLHIGIEDEVSQCFVRKGYLGEIVYCKLIYNKYTNQRVNAKKIDWDNRFIEEVFDVWNGYLNLRCIPEPHSSSV